MSPGRRTALTAAVVAGLALLDGWAHRGRTAVDTLPALAPIDPHWLVIDRGDQRLRVEREGDTWHLVLPVQHPAEPAVVHGVLALAGGVQPLSAVDPRSDAVYGLEGGEQIRVRWGDDAGDRTLFVGHDDPTGATYVRLAGDETVYRARIGGRARFALSPLAWQDRTLWRVPASAIQALHVDDTTFQRRGDSFVLPDGRPADPVLIEALLLTLAELRAVDVLAAAQPAMATGHRLELELADGTRHSARIAVDGDRSLATLDDRDATYVLTGRLVHRLLAPVDDWADHRLIDLEPAAIRELEWTGSTGVVRLARGDDGSWRVIDPPGRALDPRAVATLVDFVARFRVDRFVDVEPAAAGLPGRHDLLLLADRPITLQFGEIATGALDGRDAVYARVAGDPRVGLLDRVVLDRIEQLLSP